MYDDLEIEKEDTELKKIGLELMFLTPEKCQNDKGITAVELSRELNIDIDTVKKKLNILKEANVIRSYGISPKYWRFNDYEFQRMDEDDPTYRLLVSFDDVDFDRFFQY